MITICLLSIELDILQNSIWDICSSYAVQVLVSGWAVLFDTVTRAMSIPNKNF